MSLSILLNVLSNISADLATNIFYVPKQICKKFSCMKYFELIYKYLCAPLRAEIKHVLINQIQFWDWSKKQKVDHQILDTFLLTQLIDGTQLKVYGKEIKKK